LLHKTEESIKKETHFSFSFLFFSQEPNRLQNVQKKVVNEGDGRSQLAAKREYLSVNIRRE
jgi:hypothetical protein